MSASFNYTTNNTSGGSIWGRDEVRKRMVFRGIDMHFNPIYEIMSVQVPSEFDFLQEFYPNNPNAKQYFNKNM